MSSISSPRLGKGLESLIPKSYLSSGKTITNIPVDDIVANEYQPRLHFDDEALVTLTESIKTHGLAQPIVVRRKGVKYELIAGERRLRACIKAGLESVPSIVRDLSDKESLQLALVENLDREDLNPIEEAKGYQRLVDEFDMSHQEIADLFARSRSKISNTMRLLRLPEDIQALIASKDLTEGHGRALLSLGSEKEMKDFVEKIKSGQMTVRDVENSVSGKSEGGSGEEVKSGSKSQLFAALESKLSDSVGVQVGFKGTKKKGRVTVSYTSQEQLDAIVALLETFKAPKNQQESLL